MCIHLSSAMYWSAACIPVSSKTEATSSSNSTVTGTKGVPMLSAISFNRFLFEFFDAHVDAAKNFPRNFSFACVLQLLFLACSSTSSKDRFFWVEGSPTPPSVAVFLLCFLGFPDLFLPLGWKAPDLLPFLRHSLLRFLDQICLGQSALLQPTWFLEIRASSFCSFALCPNVLALLGLLSRVPSASPTLFGPSLSPLPSNALASPLWVLVMFRLSLVSSSDFVANCSMLCRTLLLPGMPGRGICPMPKTAIPLDLSMAVTHTGVELLPNPAEVATASSRAKCRWLISWFVKSPWLNHRRKPAATDIWDPWELFTTFTN